MKHIAPLALLVCASSSEATCPTQVSLCAPISPGTSCTKLQSESLAVGATTTTGVMLPVNAHVDSVVLTGSSAAWSSTTNAISGRWFSITVTNTGSTTARVTANVSYDFGGIMNFETGDINQATWYEAAHPFSTNFALTTSGPTPRSGVYALHAMCALADGAVNGHNHRSELGFLPREISTVSGQGESNHFVLGEYWYGISTFIPSAWSDDDSSCSNCGSTDHYHLITQWHHDTSQSPGDPAMQPLQLNVFDSTIRFEHFYGDVLTPPIILWTTPLDPLKGAWHDWVVHANWSTDPAVGFITIWKDGVQIVDYHDHTAHPTGGGVDWKSGLTYDVAQTRDVYIDEMRMKTAACGNYNTVRPR